MVPVDPGCGFHRVAHSSPSHLSKNRRFTSFPNWFTGVYCDCSLDFLLCHLHAVIENLKELFRFLIFC
uniref:Uncharacterized protein n=1 Tax=Terrapene triunguis TaxID=2587831 RepID=A0A674K0N2_9SAUR